MSFELKLIKQIEDLDFALQGVGLYLDEVHERLESKQEIIQEIEDLHEEIERKKDDLESY